VRSKPSLWPVEDSLQELAELAVSAGAKPVATLIQRISEPSPNYLGRGKLEELRHLVEDERIDVVIFDDELTPTQQKVMEGTLKVKVIDRTALILDVFASRARTREGQLQIELAQAEYLLPRLAGQWSHLERLGGGIGTRGPGESQIETDRRLVRSRLKFIRAEIEKVRQSRGQQRQRRQRGDVHTVVLVGYTNAGKSALFNRLTMSDVRSRDQLFSTLDTTTRRLRTPSGRGITVSDTVGFVHKLPPVVVESFRATLEEAHEADLLLHVVDVSSPHAAEQAQVVDGILDDMGLAETPRILVLNKLDLVTDDPAKVADVGDGAAIMPGTGASSTTAVLTSALKGWGIDDLRAQIDTAFDKASAATSPEALVSVNRL
jgi:GTP-binding protein HflX